MGRKSLLLGVLLVGFLCFIPSVVGQISVENEETLYTMKNESVNGSKQLAISPTISCTQSGLDIRNTRDGNTIFDVGFWTNNELHPIGKSNVISDYEHELKVLEIQMDKTGDYGILNYFTELTDKATFELWVNIPVPDTKDRFDFMLSDPENPYCAGFSFNDNEILVPDNYMQDLQKIDVRVPSGWNHFLVNWTSHAPQIHELWLNGVLISSVLGGKSELQKTLNFASYDFDSETNFEYIKGVSLYREQNYRPFMAWNTTGLNYFLYTPFSGLFRNNTHFLENLTVEFHEQTNISTQITTSYINALNITKELMVNESETEMVFFAPYDRYESVDFFNNTGGITFLFEGISRDFPFLFNLSFYAITIQYLVVESVEINFELETIYMLGYIALCFAIMLYLVVVRQKDEPVLAVFIILTAIPMLTPDYWVLGLFYLCFFIYRTVVQIYIRLTQNKAEFR
jgi:hypothetical protein